MQIRTLVLIPGCTLESPGEATLLRYPTNWIGISEGWSGYLIKASQMIIVQLGPRTTQLNKPLPLLQLCNGWPSSTAHTPLQPEHLLWFLTAHPWSTLLDGLDTWSNKKQRPSLLSKKYPQLFIHSFIHYKWKQTSCCFLSSPLRAVPGT